MSEIKIINAKKIYHDVPVIDNLNITVPKGSLFTILGPSGCGKTTLLRMIAGFNSIEGGEFYFDDTKINNMEPSKRNIGMVFQNYAIFPHLTVRDNVAFGLKQKKVPKEELVQQTNKYLELMQIAQYADRKPDKLSGGQQQLAFQYGNENRLSTWKFDQNESRKALAQMLLVDELPFSFLEGADFRYYNSVT